jgi:hypothetical protein
MSPICAGRAPGVGLAGLFVIVPVALVVIYLCDATSSASPKCGFVNRPDTRLRSRG